MSSQLHPFIFDANFGFGDEGVFSLYDEVMGAPFPPIEGYFLLLDNTPFLLLNGQNLDLL